MGLVIEHRDVGCASCEAHDRCRALEARFAPELAANGGNWRAIFHPEGGRVGTPTRRCTAAMIARHAHRFDDGDVLEIGCGPLSGITEDFCRERNVRYTGIDPARLPVFEIPWLPGRSLQRALFSRLVPFGLHASSAHRRFVLDRFPSPKLRGRQFDLIYGASTIEHWHEDINERDLTLAAYQEDVRECWRLLRPGGVLLMNAPMFVHGNQWFVRGDVALVEACFGEEWSSVTFERWRERHDDLAPYRPVLRAAAFRERFGVELTNIWILNLVATK
jgi:SAM-dependent methyltransferase